MDQEHMEEMLKHVRIYIFVFVALAVLTGVTVWASNVHLPSPWHIVVALAIATLKGGLVALFFMHLVSEKKTIYGVLAFTVVFFLALMFLTLFTQQGMLRSIGG